MITVPEVVKELIKDSPFLEEALAEDLVNLSALARRIKPQIEEKLYKDVETGAIVMALKRLSKNLKGNKSELVPLLNKIGDISLRSNLTVFTFTNSQGLIDKQSKLLHELSSQRTSFITITSGVFETSLFINTEHESEVELIFKGEHIKQKQRELSAITLLIPEEAAEVPGVYYSILKSLAWQGINFVEVVSSFTELTIFLNKSFVDRAFSALKGFN